MWHRRPLRAAASYDEFYGFRHTPFSLTPNPQFVYPSASHELALRTILHALARREGLMLLTGAIGCGKTTLCRRLLQLLPPRTFLSLVLNPFLSADDLLKEVLEDFGLVSSADIRTGPLANVSCHELARTLQEFLGSLDRLNASAVIIVDEAQNLPVKTLEQIRLLSNFETDTAKLLQIILVGQSNLEPILALDEMRQLNQRISRKCRLEPLSPDEVGLYVDWRLSIALSDSLDHPPDPAGASLTSGGGAGDTGRTKPVSFTSRALRDVARLSAGIPRVINLLCDRALEIGCSRGAVSINRRLMRAAAHDLEIPVPASIRLGGLRPITASLIIVPVLAMSAAFWHISRSGRLPSPPAAAVLAQSSPRSVRGSAAEPPPPVGTIVSPALNPQLSVATIIATHPSFDVLVASFQTVTRARTVASDLSSRGYPARIKESGPWQAVIVGPYSSQAEAEATRQALAGLNFSGVKVLASSTP